MREEVTKLSHSLNEKFRRKYLGAVETVKKVVFKGAGVAVVTPYTETGIDYKALAQLIAEKDNPKTDIWFGGTGDPHLQAAEQGLTLEYKSPQLPQLYPWAQKQAADSKYRTVGVYLGPLGFGYNKELLA